MTITIERLLSGSATVDWVSPAMTGTTKQVTEAVELADRARDCSWAPAWEDATGVTGVFGVELSNDAIKWTPGVLDTDFTTIGAAPAADDETQRVQGSFRARYVRLTYTNATNTGTLTQGVHVNGKRGARRAAGRDTVESLAGDSLVFHYRQDAFTPGAGPDVAIATNLQGNVLLNLDQAVAASRPHKDGNKWDFNQAIPQYLDVTGLSTPPFSAGDFGSILFVGKYDETSSDVPLDLSLGAVANTGIATFAAGTSFFGSVLTASSGLKSVTVDSDTNEHVFRLTLTDSDLVIAVDGAETTLSLPSNGGFANNLDTITLGRTGAATAPFDGFIREAIAMNGHDAQQVLDVEALLMSNYGL